MGYGSLWDTYGFVTQQFASAAPLMVTHGNHESDVRTFFAPPPPFPSFLSFFSDAPSLSIGP